MDDELREVYNRIIEQGANEAFVPEREDEGLAMVVEAVEVEEVETVENDRIDGAIVSDMVQNSEDIVEEGVMPIRKASTNDSVSL